MNLIKTKSFELAIYSKGNPESEKFALVIPGRVDTKDYAHLKSHVDYLSSKGYFTVSFDPPGTWESPGGMGLYTVANYLKAINEVIEYFGNKKTLIVGHSFGGSMAMLAGTTNPLIIAFVSIFSIYSYKPEVYGRDTDKSWEENGYKITKRDIPGSEEIKEFKIPYSFAKERSKYEMLEGLKTCAKPKMFVYGTKDTTVEPELVKTAFNESAEPKMIKELNSDHDYRKDQKLIEQVNVYLGEFLESYL